MKPIIQEIFELGFPWQTADPFLFCVHHLDHYPNGDQEMGPKESLNGRNLGQDFEIKDGWRMYHGQKVPGFPGHPHRGFETITVVKQGMVDHADSLGAAGRYGKGDVQWMTAGKGIQHSEMFPLLHQEEKNTLELFQIWLNLPAKNKMVEPHFKMFWQNHIPKIQLRDEQDHSIHLEIIAGKYSDTEAMSPPPNSWAAQSDHQVAIWLIELAPDAEWVLPAVEGVNRSLYYYQGEQLTLAGTEIQVNHGVHLDSPQNARIKNGLKTSFLVLLQGQPIQEPVAQYGPFVMNTKAEIVQAMNDYQKDQFGGWPWPEYEQVHGRKERFARHADGHVERFAMNSQ